MYLKCNTENYNFLNTDFNNIAHNHCLMLMNNMYQSPVLFANISRNHAIF